MKTHTMTEAENNFSRIIREAKDDQVLITNHGKPAAVIIGFHDEDDWLDYRLEHDERFLNKIAQARQEIREGQFVSLDDLPD